MNKNEPKKQKRGGRDAIDWNIKQTRKERGINGRIFAVFNLLNAFNVVVNILIQPNKITKIN